MSQRERNFLFLRIAKTETFKLHYFISIIISSITTVIFCKVVFILQMQISII